MSTRRPLYWLLIGALIGFGVIAILSIGLPFIVLGLILLGLAWPLLRRLWGPTHRPEAKV